MEELLIKCKAMYEVNENMITSLETNLSKFGYKMNPKRAARTEEELLGNCVNLI
jgi:hypothetical protein